MSKTQQERRVVMARRIARRWIAQQARPEYRFQVLAGARDIRNLPNLMRSFRDGKVAMANVKPVPDLGIEEGFDALSLWSKNREALASLNEWFEKRGFETTGIW